jgi:transcriptional regulator with XRE-family HTH domain
MTKNWIEQLTNTPAKRSAFEQELAVANATELLSRLLEERGMSKAELARALGTSRANVTSLLNGSRNMTVRTMAAVAAALGVRITFRDESLLAGEFIVAEPPQRAPRAVHAAPSVVPAHVAGATSDDAILLAA